MKKLLIITLFLSLIILSGCNLKTTSLENKPVACSQEAKICPDGSAVGRTGSNCEFALCPEGANKNQNAKFVFMQDYKVEQDDYSKGGDWPTGKKITIFKKGDVVSGEYGLNGCQGEGCVPLTIVIIDVNGQNWPVDTLILQPVPATSTLGDLKGVDCPVGKVFFDKQCACPSPWNIRTGSGDNGFQCVGMPDDSRR